MTGTMASRSRLLSAATPDYADHVGRLGAVPDRTPEELIAAVTAAGLTGRGGGAFPSGRKLAAVAAGGRGVVVGNGAEGEPASSKDRTLLSQAPHLVLDGLALAARAVGARRAYLYAPQDLLDGPVAAALAQRPAAAVQLVPSVDTFVSGQESAVVSVINGGRSLPTNVPPAVFERGVDGRPTLVQNVETLAQIALVARGGPDWFRSEGTREEPGTRLFTVSGAVRRPGVYELPGGSPLGDLVDAAGGAAVPLQALLIGGYHGGWVPWTAHTADLPCERSGLTRWDAAPGAGVVVALAASHCGLRAGADIAAYLAGETAGQCGPCRNGLPAAAGLLGQIAYGRATPATVAELRRVVGLVDGRGACQHPGGTARLIRSTMRTFAEEATRHAAGSCGSATVARRRSS